MIYILYYLFNFLGLNFASGNPINLLNGKHQNADIDISKQLQELLNHKDVIFDLYPIFMRNQVFKKQYPKWESKFSIFTEVSEEVREIPDCQKIIDFTRNSYSIEMQNHIHVLYENTNGKRMLVQFEVSDSLEPVESDLGAAENEFIKPISIV